VAPPFPACLISLIQLSGLLKPGGTLLPIQNGGVPQMLGDRLGECVLGGLSNLGATMTELGIYEQRNAGHLLIGELAGGESERVERVRQWLWPRGGAKDLAVGDLRAGRDDTQAIAISLVMPGIHHRWSLLREVHWSSKSKPRSRSRCTHLAIGSTRHANARRRPI